jgi:hypothetical protein
MYGIPRPQARRSRKKLEGPVQWPVPPIPCLALSNDWRRGFTLADILRAASDAQESQHRGH